MGYALLQQSVQLTEMICGNCGVLFAMPEAMRIEKERDGGNWYCPNGHSRVYKETEAARYKRLLEEANRQNTELAARVATAVHNEVKANTELRRIKRRVQGGVCPCCNRTFQNLARHMQTKHPEHK